MTTRACTACGIPNEADARFCEGCGTALERTCGACGVTVSATARFCKSCGSPLDGESSPAAEGPTRKIVTVLFADLAGSTAFEEIVDAETAREVIGRYHELLRSTAERHRAGVTKYIGDGFMAVWGVPEIGADDAGRAVDAAVELQEHFVGLALQVAEAHGVELALRVAVNTGEVVVGADDADLVGDALNVGARLESECPHGQVVLGEETWRSTRGRHRYEPLGAVRVKGRQAPVSVYRWLGQRSEAAETISFVGRGDELQRLRRVFDNAVTARAARLVTVTGDPGVGKTRLAAEFAGSLPGARVIDLRCAVEGSPALAPVVEVLRPLDLEAEIPAGAAERDRMLRDLTGMTAGVPGSVEETFWALRRLVEVLAAATPVVVIFDDIQWADSLLLDFIEHLAEWVRGVPVLMLALARPELRETRPDLVTVGGWVTEAVRLRGLEADATAELAGRVLGSDRLPEELLRRLPTSTGGNPLFVRELVGMLVHDGVLAAKPDGWRLTVDADDIDVPPTIQALLASRLERLKSADRRVLEVASVIGTDFTGSGVTELSGLRSTEITAALDRLRRLDLAQPSGTYAGDEAVWRFHHVLIRDVAYRRLLKSERADLHERLANWVAVGGTNLAFESDEVVARNLEAAQGYRADLGLRDAHGAELALRSARSYLSSARRALDRDELVSAGTQAARGAALAAADPALHAELLLVACEALLSAGDVAAGSPLVDDLERIAGEALAPWAICYRCQLVVYTDPSRLPEADARLQDAIDEFARRGDAAGLAKAHRVRANARARLGRVGDAEIDLFEALIAARRGGDHRQITAALGAAPNAALWGPSPAPKAGGRCLDVVRMQRMTTAAPSLEATSLRCLAVLELLRGRPDKARTMLADARQVVAELGLRHGLMETELYAGIIELMVGDPVAAEPHFRTALEGLDALGVGADAGQAAALLARSVLAQGRLEEADRYAAESERIAGHNLKTAIGWRAVRAEILSARGQHEAAVAKAREAVAVAADTDLVLDHADACLALSRVLEAAGDASGAAHARSDAESLYAAKDAVFMVGRTAQAASLAATPAPTAVSTGSRLVVRNRASDLADVGWRGIQDHDVEAVAAIYSDRSVYDDRRPIGGDPLTDVGWSREAAERVIADYPHAEWQTLAVRGDTMALVRGHLWDDAGNESLTLNVFELAADGLLGYHGRFEGDDFESAYREMEARYYAGEGAAFAEIGQAASTWVDAMSRRDVEAARRISWPDFRWVASPSSLKPEERSIDELFAWQDERARQLSAMQIWAANIHWISPNCGVSFFEIHGTGTDGEEYDWSRIYASEYRGGLTVSVREFDVDDEDAAFTYAESLVTPKQRRLVVANAASRVADRLLQAFRAKDVGAALQEFSADITYEERRALAGGLLVGIDYLRQSVPALLTQYNHFEGQTLAVRGERLCLTQSRWWDDSGNTAANLHVGELDEDGRLRHLLYFDAEDFASAYRELDARYYTGEGAAYVAHGRTQSAFVAAMDNLDADTARQLCQPEFRWSSPTRALAEPVRTIDEVVSWWRDRAEQVDSLRNWTSAIYWLSPDIAVSTGEARGISRDGADYSWSGIFVASFRDGLLESVNGFEPEDEDDAFACAQSLVKQRNSRLVGANAASRARDQAFAAFQRNDPSAVASLFSTEVIYEDRRPIAGALQTGVDYLNEVIPALLSQYQHFETRTVAVRGDRLCLAWSRFSDEDGNEATNLHITELGEDRLIARLVYFVEEDFWSAYREMETRYFDDQGAPYATGGRAAVDWVTAISNGDLEGVRRVSHPDFRWYATPSAFKEPERTVDDMFRWWQERGRQVSSQRHWVPAVQWLSPDCGVGLGEVEAVGPDGEKYNWSFIHVCECRNGLVLAVREFDDEDSAFAYAESVVAPTHSRLAIRNASSDVAHRMLVALQAGDFDTIADAYAEHYVHADHRRLGGGPITNRASARAAWEKIAQLYSKFEIDILAVRGERLHLLRYRWSDNAGNQSIGLALTEARDGLIVFQDRFDEGDFGAAYAALEHRYYAGEGAPYAAESTTVVEMVLAENRGDLDGAFSVFLRPGLQIENRSRSVFPTRTATELRRSVEALGAMVTSYRVWSPAYCWLSPNWVVARHEREAVGDNGETYRWSRLYAGEIRGGLFTSLCEFDADDEQAAFAYAVERMRATPSGLTLSNRASEMAFRGLNAVESQDFDSLAAAYSDEIIHETHRRFAGGRFVGRSEARASIERLREQYSRFELRTLAIRGDRLHLAAHRWSDEAGNESRGLLLTELDEDEQVLYQAIFDEDDFDSAYRELERRYYAREGAEFAENGRISVEFVEAMDALDVEAARRLCLPNFRIFNPPATMAAQERSLDEFFGWQQERAGQVASVKNYGSVMRWLSPSCFVARGDVVARGIEGEEYTWIRIYVFEFRDGLLASIRQFEDEQAAFAYAEERAHAPRSRLAVANRASATAEGLLRAMQSHDVEALLAVVADGIRFDDHRRLSGDPIHGKADARVAIQRILQQFSRFEVCVLAVRGERLALYLSTWFDGSGNETAYLHVMEVDEDGRIMADARFDEEDFVGAFGELEARYYAGEGAAFAESGKTATDVMIAGNKGELDKLFGELATPGLRVDSRSGTIFPDRTPAELRDSIELFQAMVSSSRIWYSAVQWLSPNCAVARQERDAVGKDGERYEWSRIYVAEFEHGRFTALCEFDVGFEEQAFAYAEERVRAAQSRLAVRNQASDVAQLFISALRDRDLERILSFSSDDLALDDRRRLAASSASHASEPNLRCGQEFMRAAGEGLLRQFNTFELGALAVRGDRLALCVGRWSDHSGNESVHHIVFELTDDGRLGCLVYFDEDDLDGAYQELENRYYAGEGAEFAEYGLITAEYVTTMNRGDFDTMFNGLTSADLRVEIRARSVFAAPSAEELRAHFEDLYGTLASVRSWFSALRWVSPKVYVGRLEREGIGYDGERFAWTWFLVNQYRDGRLASIAEFDEDDEDAAFAYAEEERVRAAANLLAVSNQASEVARGYVRAMNAGDVAAAADHAADEYEITDRRRLSGDPVCGRAAAQAAIDRIMKQYSHFESRVLAVRGDNVALTWSRWSDDTGNESSYLHVLETGTDMRIVTEVRFDEDDFDGAYRELEARYYAGLGDEYATHGKLAAEYVLAANRGDFDSMFGEMSSPDLLIENRSRSFFPDRNADELRTTYEELYAMVPTLRSWFSIGRWLSPTVWIGRLEREGVGHDGERFSWSRIMVNEYRDGRVASMCNFDADDEAGALAYAEGLAAQT